MPKVVVYMSSVSGMLKAKKEERRIQDILAAKKVEFEQIDISVDEEAKNYMQAKSGMNTFPQIFVDGEYKGNCEQLDEANEYGETLKWLGLE